MIAQWESLHRNTIITTKKLIELNEKFKEHGLTEEIKKIVDMDSLIANSKKCELTTGANKQMVHRIFGITTEETDVED